MQFISTLIYKAIGREPIQKENAQNYIGNQANVILEKILSFSTNENENPLLVQKKWFYLSKATTVKSTIAFINFLNLYLDRDHDQLKILNLKISDLKNFSKINNIKKAIEIKKSARKQILELLKNSNENDFNKLQFKFKEEAEKLKQLDSINSHEKILEFKQKKEIQKEKVRINKDIEKMFKTAVVHKSLDEIWITAGCKNLNSYISFISNNSQTVLNGLQDEIFKKCTDLIKINSQESMDEALEILSQLQKSTSAKVMHVYLNKILDLGTVNAIKLIFTIEKDDKECVYSRGGIKLSNIGTEYAIALALANVNKIKSGEYVTLPCIRIALLKLGTPYAVDQLLNSFNLFFGKLHGRERDDAYIKICTSLLKKNNSESIKLAFAPANLITNNILREDYYYKICKSLLKTGAKDAITISLNYVNKLSEDVRNNFARDLLSYSANINRIKNPIHDGIDSNFR